MHKEGSQLKNAFAEYNHIHGTIEGIYHTAAVKMGLSDSELWILYSLSAGEKPIHQTELIKFTGMKKTTVNSALKKMEREGLLSATPADGRNTCISLTENGRLLAERTVCRLIELENKIYESWSPEDQEIIIRINRDYAEKLSEAVKML